MRFLAPRRGALAAFAVGIAILVLYVALQPGERPEQRATAATSTSSTLAPSTTIDPIDELCALAQQFAQAVEGQDLITSARLAEEFYERGSELAPPNVRPEFEAALRYYTEFNDIGELYGYDLFAAMASPDAQRWSHLVFSEPLGVPAARSATQFLCGVELPPPPTITTTTTRPRPSTTAPPDSTPAETPGDPTPSAPSTPPAPTPPPATG